jgi:V/A-type H+-transporting ATPase subunit I
MPSPDRRGNLSPARMERIAVVAPSVAWREALVRVATEGTVELDRPEVTPAVGEAGRRIARLHERPAVAALSLDRPDLDGLERDGRTDLLAGEAELEEYASAAVSTVSVSALTAWVPAADLPALNRRLAEVGGAGVPLARPAGVDPPTLMADTPARRPFAPLVDTYATVPYADIDPSVVAGVAYVVMFGMMFADAGHGLLLLVGALFVRTGRPQRLASLRPVWPFLAGAGLTSMVFGLLYGEFFGPTGVLPVLWLAPLEQPVQLLLAGIGVGAVLLALAYGLGALNRWREGGWRYALYASSGLAGAGLFLGLGMVVGGWYTHQPWLLWSGVGVAVIGLVLTFVGLLTDAGHGGAAVLQASVELFDVVIRLGSNLVSFARLAAFGLTHAALGWVVWTATTALWAAGGFGMVTAVVVFLVGNIVTFALEGLVAAVQALRLEYYEIFSRVFVGEGRPFRPWCLPVLEGAAT